jgi:hypothetical protein
MNESVSFIADVGTAAGAAVTADFSGAGVETPANALP